MKLFLRTAGFAAGLALLLYIANTFFVTTDTLSYLSLHEMTHRDDVQLAFVGSSVARNHFVPDIVLEETGLISYNVAHPYTSLQGCNALAKLMFDHHDPKWTVLVTEPYFFESTRESTQTQFRIMPFIKNPLDRLSYYVDCSTQDERWLDRLVLPRQYCVTDVKDFLKTLSHHTDVDRYYAQHAPYAGTGASSTYRGGGFMYPNPAAPEAERMRLGAGRSAAQGIDALPEYSQEALLRFAKLCEKNGSNLMVVIFPYHTGVMLSTPDHIARNALLREFCAENNIPCFDFTLAKEDLLPPLDAYYENTEHMSYDGAAALTRAFCEVFRLYKDGQPTDHLFYPDTEAFLAELDRVVNVWIKEEAPGVYAAESNYGASVTPEYAFTALAGDGSETLLRDYSPDARYSGSIPEGMTLRVYARAQETSEDPVYFDLR